MMAVWDFILESGSLTILFWMVIVVVGLLIIGAVGWWVFTKFFVYKYNFAVIMHSGEVKPKKAKIVRGENSIKKFEIDGYSGQLLDVRDANGLVDGVPRRIVAFDGMGNLVYTEDFKNEDGSLKNLNSKFARIRVDKEEYYKTALKPVEREQIANNIIASVKKYGKMDATMKYSLILGVILLIAVIVGIVIQGKILAKQYEVNGGAVDKLADASETQRYTAEVIKNNTEVQKIILGYFINRTDITFTAK